MSDTVFNSFEWDSTKAEVNVSKHGVSFAEATTVFEDPNAYYFDNGSPEGRITVIGFSIAANLLLVVSAEGEADRTRIISARKASRAERARYESQE